LNLRRRIVQRRKKIMANIKPRLGAKGLIMALVASLLLLTTVTAWAAETRSLKVDGLACPFCAYGIEKQLRAVRGVKNVTVSVKTGTVIVTMTDGASLSQARASQAVKDAGFTLRSFR
jgi:mercuric ion binding protein